VTTFLISASVRWELSRARKPNFCCLAQTLRRQPALDRQRRAAQRVIRQIEGDLIPDDPVDLPEILARCARQSLLLVMM
jgi:hypothetical protein